MERMLKYLNRKGQVLLSCYAGKQSVECPEFHMQSTLRGCTWVFTTDIHGSSQPCVHFETLELNGIT